MLAFVDLNHALPTRGGYPIHGSRGSFASREEKVGEMHLFICSGELAFGAYPIHGSRGSFASREEKVGEMHLFICSGELAFGSSFSLGF
jgi:hypothetical protein